jgi:Uma2 family endonuclease
MTVSKALLPKTKVNQPKNNRMSYEEFLAWADEDTLAEWVDGDVIPFMPVKIKHQRISNRLFHLIEQFIKLFKLGEVWSAPTEMRLRSGQSIRQPDIFFVLQANLHRFKEDWLDGPADLVIEIISTESVQRDRRDKFREFEQAGITEYWIIDPRSGKQRADFYRLDETGRYQLFGLDEDEWVESEVLKGFRLRPQWLWQTESLNPYLALGEMLGNETFLALLKQNLEPPQG